MRTVSLNRQPKTVSALVRGGVCDPFHAHQDRSDTNKQQEGCAEAAAAAAAVVVVKGVKGVWGWGKVRTAGKQTKRKQIRHRLRFVCPVAGCCLPSVNQPAALPQTTTDKQTTKVTKETKNNQICNTLPVPTSTIKLREPKRWVYGAAG